MSEQGLPPMTDRKHLSASQLDMFAKCPESWRRRYLEGEIIPPRLAMLKGSAIHSAAEHNMRQKIESYADLPVKEITDFAVSAYEDKLKRDSYTLGENETLNDAAEMKSTVASMAQVHAERQAPDYQPVAVEQRFTISLPMLDHDLVGVADLITDQREVVDFKTGKRSLSQSDADESTQLSIYAASVQRDNPGVDAVNVTLDMITEPGSRSAPKRVVIHSHRDRSDLPILANRVEVVSRTIAAGLFPPAAPGSWWCSADWCGYYATCKYVNKARIDKTREVNDLVQILSKQRETNE
jgi:hypothetical protein